ncbi:shikimate kinase [Fictibacillus aquaticus]|uniref:Shikimate kinase n=1 Tax=Fictibacillus aquaticus TaxID=2021314 RepID=A0A235F8Y1_9BACL|nr:shikimate kinase [Fictibacillus aquaticus]OYD57821.1 hypothetical protein CGZ90_07920 [Fictibacillus aquaticus]
MKTIYLTGFMGSGKSSAGTILSRLLGVPYYDMDSEIEVQTGKNISSIFAEEGERAFRELETEMLKKMPEYDCVVITGGGLPVSEANRNYMKNTGYVVYLKTSFGHILSRLDSKEEREKRPVLSQKSEEDIRQLLEQRVQYYEDCDVFVLTDKKSPHDVAEEILSTLRLNMT